ncbi:GNAT family protein [Tenacibaculum sp. 190524A05c]|uniref:RimJ/RimL family protein N-acetyltransferase n=1 Tax=Tenacibaculum platacis TaxID=3137852 RepID=A0ABM9NVC9_9FLAO
MALSVREIELRDIDLLLDYWYTSNEEHFVKMGADIHKLPKRNEFHSILEEQIITPIQEKKSYALIWEENGVQIGHTNANSILFGKEAFMHLHVWNTTNRRKGSGVELVKKSLQFYFKNLQIETLFCQPYALNPAPNKTLEKVGFEFVKAYVTIPGSINFEQKVNLWKMTRKQFISS